MINVKDEKTSRQWSEVFGWAAFRCLDGLILGRVARDELTERKDFEDVKD